MFPFKVHTFLAPTINLCGWPFFACRIERIGESPKARRALVSVLGASRRPKGAATRPFSPLGLQSFFLNRACIAFTAGDSKACLIISRSQADGITNRRGTEPNIACKWA